MPTSTFYHKQSASRVSRVPPTTPPTAPTTDRSSSASSSSSFETPLSSRQNAAMASNISILQEQLTSVLKKLEETNGTLEKLSNRIDVIEEKLSKEQTADSEDAVVSKGRKRKRPKDSLAVQVLFHDFFS